MGSTVYPSALGRDPLDVPASLSAGLGARSTLDREFDRTFEKDFSSRHLDSDLSFTSGLGARSALSDLEHDLKFSSRGRSPLTPTGHSATRPPTIRRSTAPA